MPHLRRLSRSLALLVSAFAFVASVQAAHAATQITGVVTNKTTNKPSAGDTVTLVRLAQGMQDATHTTTDARGHYTLEVPDDGIHLVRVTHEKANYFQPAPPGTKSVNMDVYEAAEHVEGVSTTVEEMHFEADANTLHVVEVLEVTNSSSPAMTQFGPKGFDFYLPQDARVEHAGAMRDQLPVPATASPVGDAPGHYMFLFPIRPGETQFGIVYSVPYTGKLSFQPKLTTPVDTIAVVLPKSMKLAPDAGTSYTAAPTSNAGPSTDTYVMQHAMPGIPLGFTLSGQGSLPRDSEGTQQQQQGGDGAPVAATDNTAPGKGLDNPLDPSGERDPWAKYKWWILAGLAVLLVIAAGFLLRKPADAAATSTGPITPMPKASQATLLDAIKEEMFALETERLQQRISEQDYAEAKAALELILKRALARTAPAAGTEVRA